MASDKDGMSYQSIVGKVNETMIFKFSFRINQ